MRKFLAFLVALAAGLWLGVRVSQGPSGEPQAASPAQEAAARAYLKANLPAMPQGWEFDLFAPERGVALEVGRVAAPDAKGTILFVPGYTAPLELYAQEMRALAEAGWDVAAIVMRGQGRSVRLTQRYDLGHVTDYAELSADLAAFVARQRGPVAVVGLSQGAHVALRMAAEHGPEVAAYALIVPMIDVRTAPAPRPVARAVASLLARNGAARRYLPGTLPWARRTPFAQVLGRGTICQPDPALAHLRRALMEVHPELRVEVPSPGWAAATFASIERLRLIEDRIDDPVLMVTAGRDRVVRNRAVAAMCGRLRDCRRVELPRAPHCMVEGDRDRSAAVMGRVAGFLAERAE